MRRQLRHFLAFLLLMQIATLGGDIERILQFAHGETPWILTALWG